MNGPTITERVDFLGAVRELLARTKRVTNSKEPAAEINQAYVDLVFACGFSVVRDAERARALWRAADATLRKKQDAIHSALTSFSGVRINDAIAGEPRTSALQRFAQELAAFDRVERYKVDRFFEASWLVGGDPQVDAAMRFARRGRWPEDREVLAADHEERVARLVRDLPTLDQDHADYFIGEALGSHSHLPRDVSRRLLDQLVPLLPRITESNRALSIAWAIHAAARNAPDHVDTLSEAFVESIAVAYPSERNKALSLAASGLRNLQPQLRRLWRQLPDVVKDTEAFVEGLLWSRDPAADAKLQALVQSPQALPEGVRLAALTCFFELPFDRQRAEVSRIAEIYARTTDAWSTNSHFTFWVIELVDIVVAGIVEDASPTNRGMW